MESCCLGFLWDPLSRNVQNSTGEAVSWLWNLVVGRILNLILLASREEELRREMKDLADLRRDLLAEISNGELHNMGPTQQAKTWLREAEDIGARATDFLVSYQQSGASSEGSSLRSSYQLGCEAAECLKQVKRLKSERRSLPPLIEAPPPAVLPLPSSSNYDSVGAEETLSEIRRLVVEDDEAGIIGIYGMGGIGKTTLLREINDELLQRGPGGFDLVIWVTVSKQLDIRKVQKVIADRLGYSGLPEDPTERVNILVRAQFQRKILLLLDDIWEQIDLGDLGISSSSFRNGSKVVFTTRSLEVCNRMEAQRKVKVPLLNPANSWELFCQKLDRGEDQWDPSITSLAEAACKKSGGLPIALITVGRAMAEATTRPQWDAALTQLKGIPVDLGDMEEKVLRLLKFSFDRLKDASARECLLYCALFPEDRSIPIQPLIEFWVGEGLLDRGSFLDPIDTARSRGHLAIKSLKAACLLEDGDTEGVDVKLHDTVREMALWITSGQCDGENGNVFLVNPSEGLTRVPTPERWTEATRISLMLNQISVLPEEPQCDKLKTLLMCWNSPLREIPVGFFKFMPMLRVLDLCFAQISHLPSGISSLVELRHLNLSFTSLRSLPMELGRLIKLRKLYLEHISFLKRIPRESISSLAGLQSLNMDGSGYEWGGGWEEGSSDCASDHEGRELCLKDLDGLGQLTELSLSISGMTEKGMQALQENHKRLCPLIRSISLKEMGSKSFDLSACLKIMKGIRKLGIVDCTHLEELVVNTNQLSELEELTLNMLPLATISWRDDNVSERGPSTAAIFKNLVNLYIFRCEALEDITWIRDLPCIQTISLAGCSKIEELIVVEEVMMGQNVADFESDSFFPKLKVIKLIYLLKLRSICRHPLLFPSLESVKVSNCPKLKRLPFGLPSAKNIKQIRGEQEWWNGLEWDHEDVRSRFTPYFYRDGYLLSITTLYFLLGCVMVIDFQRHLGQLHRFHHSD